MLACQIIVLCVDDYSVTFTNLPCIWNGTVHHCTCITYCHMLAAFS